ncbi:MULTISPECIES: hypothetical protein [Lysinibacillus]|nr:MULTISPECIES: hypothetical protein [Lysinibacillus]MBX8945599.1 hypothetical protein [Lysinibacillus sp. K60]UUV26709.1 hypothetical protein NP781_09030 [Lysinibacillus sp. FN11]UYB49591.1 hypothetical protein OCI51_11720 [Lysinibacillus capsici]
MAVLIKKTEIIMKVVVLLGDKDLITLPRILANEFKRKNQLYDKKLV